MVKAALLLDDPVQASTLLGEIDHHLRFEPDDAVTSRRHVAALRAQVDRRARHLGRADVVARRRNSGCCSTCRRT
jgi:hypothetical protein